MRDIIRNQLRRLARASKTQRSVLAPAILVLALGIGAATTIFSVVNALLLNAVPAPNPEQLVLISERNLSLGVNHISASAANWRDFRDFNHSLTDIAVVRREEMTLDQGSDPERIQGALVSRSFFNTYGARLEAGRLWTQKSDTESEQHVAVISRRMAVRLFGSSASALGASLHLGSDVVTIIGVLPEQFRYPSLNADVWMPLLLSPADLAARDVRWLGLLARMKPGVSVPQAQADLDNVSRQLQEQYPAFNKGWTALVQSLSDVAVGGVRPALVILLSSAAILLLVACVNVAIVLISRSEARATEMAIRAALGAQRRRIFGRLLLESLAISVVAGGLGALLAWTADILLTRVSSIPHAETIQMDLRVLGFALFASTASCALFGLLPAWRLARRDIVAGLHSHGSSSGLRGGVLLTALLAAQVTLSFVLLVESALLVRSFDRLIHVDRGYDSRNVVTALVSLPSAKALNAPQKEAFFQQVLDQLRSGPGVEGAAATDSLPLVSGNDLVQFSIPGAPSSGREISRSTVVTPGYFETMRIPL
ncbi:MAG TPA: ABC transporter permease, partial [Blastocatellia bacterium]|nr:ABC transporter permease [Blastocatellia bacterium]